MGAERKLFVALGVNDRRLSADLKRSESKFQKFGSRVADKVNGAFSKIRFAAAGAFALASKSVFDYDDKLDRLSTQAKLTGRETKKLSDQMIAMSNETGVSRNVVVEAAAEYINLGLGAEFASKNLDTLTKAHVGTGAAVEDLIGLQFTFANSFGLIDVDDQAKALSNFIAIGDLASLPINDMAASAKEGGAIMKDFGDKGVSAATNTALAMQALNKEGFSDAKQAKTGIKNFTKQMVSRSKQLRKLGVETMQVGEDGKKGLLPFFEVIQNMSDSGIVDDPEALQKALGDFDATRAAKGFVEQLAWMKKLKKEASTRNAIEESYNKRRQSSAFKLAKAWNDIKEAIAKAITPERVEKFVQAIEALAGLVSAIVDNLKTAVALYATFKAAQLARSFGGVAGAAGAAGGGAAAINATSGLAKFGLLAQAAAVGVAIGTLADEFFGFSDSISDYAVSMFADVAKSRSRTKSALDKQLASGDIDKEQYDRDLAGHRSAFAFAGIDAVAGLVGAETRKTTGRSIEEQQSRINSMSDSEKKRLSDLAHQAAITASQGGDPSVQLDQLAKAMSGVTIDVSISNKAITDILDNHPSLGTSP